MKGHPCGPYILVVAPKSPWWPLKPSSGPYIIQLILTSSWWPLYPPCGPYSPSGGPYILVVAPNLCGGP